ncbi:histidine kinase [Flavobacterium branchiophilum]|uniref:2TM domain-containing protein n=1 Tax=Flavobacterium branchiophilum TaxID=55197 RepID=A0A543G8E0_9FLAO|nr:2TM domain-containing protein [Flavobacterium branchiophilum]OXA74597.1 histidine kinase [Flavobacterium branchiophilum] [Flavobacterium branchiophilum NBRC 15030 = ATCC 35035]TQM42343.1 2TM domain-containing protein [Flavobacterium branchiophilum]GEM55529.1 histidine kinase [Flavobacterium branchiophilum NBRC 15030 = ATCC 35035]
MENYNQIDERYIAAQKRVQEIKGFYGHLASYVLVNLFLLILNLVSSPGYLWFFWPALGWGTGLLAHGIKVFQIMPFLGKDWEERKIKELLNKEEYK